LQKSVEIDASREQFGKAIKLLDEIDNDQAQWHAAWTCVLVARFEAGLGEQDRAARSLDDARARYKRLTNERLHASGIEIVEWRTTVSKSFQQPKPPNNLQLIR